MMNMVDSNFELQAIVSSRNLQCCFASEENALMPLLINWAEKHDLRIERQPQARQWPTSPTLENILDILKAG